MNRTVLVVLAVAAAIALVVVAAAGGAYWWFHRSAPLGPLAAEALVLPTDADFLVGVDVKRVLSGANYKKYVAQRPQAQGPLDDFKKHSGVDLARDIDQLYAAGRKAGAAEPLGVAIAIGRFDAGQIEAALRADLTIKVGTRQVEGVSVLTVEDAGKLVAQVAVLDRRTLLFGQSGPFETTLGNWKRGVKAVAQNPDYVARLQTLKPAPAFWFLAGKSITDELPDQMPIGGRLPKPKELAFKGEFDPQVWLELDGTMASESDAKNLADALNGFKGMAGLMAGGKPEIAGVLAGLVIRAEKLVVIVRLSLDAAVLEQLGKSIEPPAPTAQILIDEAA